jgi:transcriptional regulator with XRE-family HTH domain
MGTSQSSIARLENGLTLPGTKTLLRYAEVTGSRFRVNCRRRDASCDMTAGCLIALDLSNTTIEIKN